MYRPESYLYESHLSLMSSYATDQALAGSFADQGLADEELLVQPSTGATILGALGDWLAEALYRGVVALGGLFAPPADPADPADPAASYWLHPPL